MTDDTPARPAGEPPAITASRIELVDEDGNVRARLGDRGDGVVGLYLYGPDEDECKASIEVGTIGEVIVHGLKL